MYDYIYVTYMTVHLPNIHTKNIQILRQTDQGLIKQTGKVLRGNYSSSGRPARSCLEEN